MSIILKGKAKIKYYWKAIKWLWTHKEEPNNRAKWRRMMRELKVEEDDEHNIKRD